MSSIAEFLGSSAVPIVLGLASVFVLLFKSRLGISQSKVSKEKLAVLSKTTPFASLTLALAGTLGVGNITGVASAVMLGGYGAVFWMWVGAIAVIPVKYAEVFLAVKHRKRKDGKWIGGAMYYIKDGLCTIVKKRTAWFFGACFALLCCLNSTVTGNLIQSNAAVSAVPPSYRPVFGAVLALAVALSLIAKGERLEKITSFIIPFLTIVYISASFFVIICGISEIPSIFKEIVTSAFSTRAAVGSAGGFAVREAIRYGMMRGILSNEAGCGTSPTAHAAADCESADSQAKLGVFEVIFDTIILCTLTALVILITDRKFGIIQWGSDIGYSSLPSDSFGMFGGEILSAVISALIILFAYSSIIAQIFYGVKAVEFLTEKRGAKIFFCTVSVLCTFIGSVTGENAVYNIADIVLGIMTLFNCLMIIIILLRGRRE